MRSQLRILQANLAKKRETQLSLLNDTGLSEFDLLLISEPYFFEQNNLPSVTPHHYWTPFLPTVFQQGHVRFSFRSLIWVNRRLRAQQIPLQSLDITAVPIKDQTKSILVFSVYIPPQHQGNTAQAELREQLQIIRSAWLATRTSVSNLECVIAGDFNRHDQLWGGDAVGNSVRQGEADRILELMDEMQLQSMLPNT
jgi:hypothetical protein